MIQAERCDFLHDEEGKSQADATTNRGTGIAKLVRIVGFSGEFYNSLNVGGGVVQSHKEQTVSTSGETRLTLTTSGLVTWDVSPIIFKMPARRNGCR